jgi:hypothetical protein
MAPTICNSVRTYYVFPPWWVWCFFHKQTGVSPRRLSVTDAHTRPRIITAPGEREASLKHDEIVARSLWSMHGGLLISLRGWEWFAHIHAERCMYSTHQLLEAIAAGLCRTWHGFNETTHCQRSLQPNNMSLVIMAQMSLRRYGSGLRWVSICLCCPVLCCLKVSETLCFHHHVLGNVGCMPSKRVILPDTPPEPASQGYVQRQS